MRLTGRVRSLERRRGRARGACRACGGLGRHGSVLELDGVPLREARGCPACGRLSHLKRVVLGSGGNPELAARIRAAWPPPAAAGDGGWP